MALSRDKRARMRLLAVCSSLQRYESQQIVQQWLRDPKRLDWRAVDILAQSILQYVVCTPHPRHRHEYLHDAEMIEAIAVEVYPPKAAYQRPRKKAA